MMETVDLKDTGQREQGRQEAFDCRLFCCGSTGCIASGCGAVRQALEQAVASRDLGERVEVVSTGCMGLCSRGPLVRVEVGDQPPVLYREVEPLVARLIVADHVHPALEQIGEAFELPDFLSEKRLSLDLPFFARQQKVVLGNAGVIDPGRIETYIARGGYAALEKVLVEFSPEEVVEEMCVSGLRGRGGAGFPTGKKWAMSQRADGEEKFVICNGDEGDPGAYMDRSVMEADPHAVLEGMLIAGYAIGAASGWVYIRAEYPLAAERIETAIGQARDLGLLGGDILGSGFSFDCQVRLSAGAFVCGEETALIASIEGERGTPRLRPPYPSECGLWGQPTCVNNVETLAAVPVILRNGGNWYAAIGTPGSSGTKLFSLTGKGLYSGLIEVPMGISLKEVVEEIGGGTASGLPIKGVQIGGLAGGVIPRDRLDVAVDYEALRQLGSIMGSGGMIVLDEEDSMVDLASFYLEFAAAESCGRCAPCRIGTRQLRDLVAQYATGQGSGVDLSQVRRLAEGMRRASLCGLGKGASSTLLSTLEHFAAEYRERAGENSLVEEGEGR